MKTMMVKLKDETEGLVEIKEPMGEDLTEEEILTSIISSAMIKLDDRDIWINTDMVKYIKFVK